MNRRQRRRRALVRRGLLLAALLAAGGWYVVGLRLPPAHREEAWAVLPGTRETVWAVLMDLDAMPSWRSDVVAVERLPDAGGVVRWLEIGRGGRLPLERVEAVALERLVVRSVGAGDRRQWTYRLEPRGVDVLLTVVEERQLPVVSRPYAALFGADRRRIDTVVRGLVDRVGGARQAVAAGWRASSFR
jgi:hypothetical protein